MYEVLSPPFLLTWQARTQKVRAFRGMKQTLIIITTLLASCGVQKPQYTKINYIKLEYYKLNPKGKRNIARNEKATIVYHHLD